MAQVALLREVGKPLEIVEATLAPPGPGEVRVRMAASGVCHSDFSAAMGIIGGLAPMVLGHEGAGVVEELGPDVTSLAVGDHVVLSWVAQCGTCYFCTHGDAHLCASGSGAAPRITVDGEPVAQMTGLGTFAAETVIPATAAVKIPKDVPLAQAALIGCGVLTGAGAAMNTASFSPGETVAVVGCGGVGLNAIQGARLAGAGQVIAIDLLPAKLELARQFGATDLVNAGEVDAVRAVRELTEGRGADVAIEVIGGQATVDQAVQMTRSGGQTVFVGIGGMDVQLSMPVLMLLGAGKSLTGCIYGSSDVQRDVPRLIEQYQAGDLLLDELISRRIALDEVNDALQLLEKGEVTRSVIEF
jgi:Zn-dependent alcohol dehydrogenase